eukprot:5466114-Prymnesium_polylepis.1
MLNAMLSSAKPNLADAITPQSTCTHAPLAQQDKTQTVKRRTGGIGRAAAVTTQTGSHADTAPPARSATGANDPRDKAERAQTGPRTSRGPRSLATTRESARVWLHPRSPSLLLGDDPSHPQAPLTRPTHKLHSHAPLTRSLERARESARGRELDGCEVEAGVEAEHGSEVAHDAAVIGRREDSDELACHRHRPRKG